MSEDQALPTAPESVSPGMRTVIALDSVPDRPGAFTIAVALASQHPDFEPTGMTPVTDVVAMAVVDIIRTVPGDFKAALEKVQESMAKAAQILAGSEDDQPVEGSPPSEQEG